MTIAIAMLALIGLVQVVKYVQRCISYWTLLSKFRQTYEEVEDYCDQGMVLNAQAGLRRLKLLSVEMEKYK